MASGGYVRMRTEPAADNVYLVKGISRNPHNTNPAGFNKQVRL